MADILQTTFFLYDNLCILIQISLKFAPKFHVHNKPAFVQIMASCKTCNKPLSEWMMAQFTDAYLCHSASVS